MPTGWRLGVELPWRGQDVENADRVEQVQSIETGPLEGLAQLVEQAAQALIDRLGAPLTEAGNFPRDLADLVVLDKAEPQDQAIVC